MLFEVTFEGIDELVTQWQRAVGDIDDGLVQAVSTACREGAAEARSTHKFQNRTGTLERSISSGQATIANGEATCTIEATAPYALYVEEGTRFHPAADGFMGRGVQKAERVLIREIYVAIARAQARMNG